MGINRNEIIAKYYALFSLEKNKNSELTFYKFNKSIDSNSFIKFVESKELKILGNIPLFSTKIQDDFDIKKNNILNFLDQNNIKSIIKDDFHFFECFEQIKKSNFFFYEGDIDILKNNIEKFVAVIGSRKTGKDSIKWIEKNVPKDKIIVSGLAKGADTYAHLTAIKNKQKIIVFPGSDIRKKIDLPRKKIINYAKENGVILYNFPPFEENNYQVSYFLERNRWMAQLSSETFITYFKGKSGTLSQMYEVSKKDKYNKIYIPSKVYEDNLEYLKSNIWSNKIISYLEKLD